MEWVTDNMVRTGEYSPYNDFIIYACDTVFFFGGGEEMGGWDWQFQI